MAASKETVYIKADRNVEVTGIQCCKIRGYSVHGMSKPTVLPKLK